MLFAHTWDLDNISSLHVRQISQHLFSLQMILLLFFNGQPVSSFWRSLEIYTNKVPPITSNGFIQVSRGHKPCPKRISLKMSSTLPLFDSTMFGFCIFIILFHILIDSNNRGAFTLSF